MQGRHLWVRLVRPMYYLNFQEERSGPMIIGSDQFKTSSVSLCLPEIKLFLLHKYGNTGYGVSSSGNIRFYIFLPECEQNQNKFGWFRIGVMPSRQILGLLLLNTYTVVSSDGKGLSF